MIEFIYNLKTKAIYSSELYRIHYNNNNPYVSILDMNKTGAVAITLKKNDFVIIMAPSAKALKKISEQLKR